jgi:hypothetical protein
LLLAEFAAQFPTEAAELEIFERQDQSGLHSAACQIAMHSPRTRRASPGAASLGRNASVPMRSRTSKAKQAPRYRKPLAMSQGKVLHFGGVASPLRRQRQPKKQHLRHNRPPAPKKPANQTSGASWRSKKDLGLSGQCL